MPELAAQKRARMIAEEILDRVEEGQRLRGDSLPITLYRRQLETANAMAAVDLANAVLETLVTDGLTVPLIAAVFAQFNGTDYGAPEAAQEILEIVQATGIEVEDPWAEDDEGDDQ